jgi:hypothetical protein
VADVDVRVKLSHRWEGDVYDIGTPALNEAARIVRDGQRRRIPVSRDGSYGRPPGYARDKIHVRRGIEARVPTWDVGTGDDALTPDGTNYPLILELGSRPHVIRSKGDYPLRNAKTGQVFGREVQHPGTQPQPWLRAALADIEGMTFR